jgi:hypothetical protein
MFKLAPLFVSEKSLWSKPCLGSDRARLGFLKERSSTDFDSLPDKVHRHTQRGQFVEIKWLRLMGELLPNDLPIVGEFKVRNFSLRGVDDV